MTRTPEGLHAKKVPASSGLRKTILAGWKSNGPRETHESGRNDEKLGTRGSRRAIERLVNPDRILLMFQFVSHSAQQMRHAKGLLESLPCPEEFRDIQDILFSSCA